MLREEKMVTSLLTSTTHSFPCNFFTITFMMSGWWGSRRRIVGCTTRKRVWGARSGGIRFLETAVSPAGLTKAGASYAPKRLYFALARFVAARRHRRLIDCCFSSSLKNSDATRISIMPWMPERISIAMSRDNSSNRRRTSLAWYSRRSCLSSILTRVNRPPVFLIRSSFSPSSVTNRTPRLLASSDLTGKWYHLSG